MEDIRAIEKETAEMLKKTMAGEGEITSDDGEYKPGFDLESSQAEFDTNDCNNETAKAQFSSLEYHEADVPNILPKVIKVILGWIKN